MKVSYRDKFGNWRLSQDTIEQVEIEVDFGDATMEYNEGAKVLIIREMKGEVNG